MKSIASTSPESRGPADPALSAPTDADRRRGLAATLAAYLLFGFFPLYWKLIEIPALQVTLWRMSQAMVVMVTVMWFRRRLNPLSLFADRRAALIHLLASLLLIGNWFVYVYAVATDRVVDASLGYFVNPLVSVGLGVVVLRERLDLNRLWAVALAVIGVAVLTVEAGRLPWISLGLAVSFGLYGLVRKQSPRGALEGLTTELLWLGPVAAMALGFLGLSGRLAFGGPVSATAMVAMGVVTATPLALLSVGFRSLPLSLLGLIQYLTPTIQFLLGVILYREPVTAGRWVGIGFIWAALVVLAVLGFDRGGRAATARS